MYGQKRFNVVERELPIGTVEYGISHRRCPRQKLLGDT